MAHAPVEDPEAASLIAEAADLARHQKATERRLAEIKDILRGKAEDIDGERMVVFESPAGAASVIFVGEVPRLASGADPERLMAKFAGAAGVRWEELFRKRWLLAPEWQEALAREPKPVQKAVNALVEWEPSTPRVVLPK